MIPKRKCFGDQLRRKIKQKFRKKTESFNTSHGFYVCLTASSNFEFPTSKSKIYSQQEYGEQHILMPKEENCAVFASP